MTDIAQIGIAIDTQPVEDAKQALNGLAPAAGKAESATNKFAAAFDKLDGSANKIVTAANGLVMSIDKLTASLGNNVSKVAQSSVAGEKLAKVLKKQTASNDNATKSTKKFNDALSKQAILDAEVERRMMRVSVAVQNYRQYLIKAGEGYNGIIGGTDSLIGKLTQMRTLMTAGTFSNADLVEYANSLDTMRAKFNPVFAVIQQYKKNLAEIREANALGALSVDEMNEALSRQRKAALTAISGLKDVKPAVVQAPVVATPDLTAMRAKFNPVFAVIQQYKTNIAEIREANTLGALGVDEMNEALSRQRKAALTAISGLKGVKPAVQAASTPAGTRERYDPLFATLTQYKKLLNEIRADEAAGIISRERSVISQGMLRRATMRSVDSLRALDPALRKSGSAAKLTGIEMLNLSRQFADIGVTAAMGMNPLMILVQQGPQIADVFSTAAMRGMTFNQTLKAITASLRGMMTTAMVAIAPFLPLIAGLATVVGMVTASIGLGVRAINKNAGDLSKSLGLTKEQIDRVNKAGVSMSITFGDVVGAAFEVAGERLYEAFEGPLSWLEKRWNEMLDWLTGAAGTSFDFLVGASYVLIHDLKTVFWTLPQAAGEAFVDLANTAIREINRILPAAMQLQEMFNPFAGASAELANFSANGLAAQARGQQAGASFRADVAGRAEKNRRAKIVDAAGKPAKTPKSRGKSDAEKFSDIVNGAQRDIASVEAEIKGVNLTADAALRLKNEQKLLNEAQQKGIALTGAQRAKLMELAGTLTDAQVKLKNLEGIRDIFKGADDQADALDQEFETIGKVGFELSKMTAQYNMINQAKEKGLTITKDMLAEIEREAGILAGKSERNTAQQAFMDQKISMEEQLSMLQAEADAIGLNAVETEKLMFARQLENDQKYRGIGYSAQQIADLTALNAGQIELTETVRKQQEQFEFSKDTVKGFFKEFRSGISEGKSIWNSFADAAVNAIGRIVDRLIDMQLEMLLSQQGGSWLSALGGLGSSLLGAGMSGGLGGGGGSFSGSSVSPGVTGPITMAAKGKAFDGARYFAKGDMFNSPTAFMFGKGGSQLGIMGEAGPEAIMPLTRGPDGSLGVQMYGGGQASRPSAPQALDVRLAVVTEEGPMFRTTVKQLAQNEALGVTQEAFNQYDAQMPERFKQIANDDRVRG